MSKFLLFFPLFTTYDYLKHGKSKKNHFSEKTTKRLKGLKTMKLKIKRKNKNNTLEFIKK